MQLNVTGYITISVAQQDVTSYKLIIPYAAINRSAYGVIQQDAFDLVVKESTGNLFENITSDAQMLEKSLRIERYVAASDSWLVHPISDEIAESEMMDGLRLRLLKVELVVVTTINPDGLPVGHQEEKLTVLDEVDIPVIQENPMPFPRSETEWSKSLLFKNGEYMLLDNVVYMWNHYQSGNSDLDPKSDIAKNPLTTRWSAYQNWAILFTNAVIAKFGLVGAAVFINQYMISQYGIDSNGDPSNDYRDFGGIDFIPNIMLDFLSGKSKLGDTEITGTVVAKLLYSPSNNLNFNSGYNLNPMTDGATLVVNGGGLTPVLKMPDPTLWPGLTIAIYTEPPLTRIDNSIILQCDAIEFYSDEIKPYEAVYKKYRSEERRVGKEC